MKESSAKPLSPDSQVTQDYLKAVWTASEWGGPGASITGLANRMGVVPSTASETVSRLVEAGLLAHEPYRAVLLTEEGRRRAVKQIRRHRILETYLATVLDYGWEEVHEEAEVLEHAISDRLLERLDAALGHPRRDPHGDPIPQADGSLEEPPLRLVETLEVGESGVVGRIFDDPQVLRALDKAGIGLDTRVRLVAHGLVPQRQRAAHFSRATDRRRRADKDEGQAPAGRMHAVVIAKDEGEPAQGCDTQATVPLESLWLLA